ACARNGRCSGRSCGYSRGPKRRVCELARVTGDSTADHGYLLRGPEKETCRILAAANSRRINAIVPAARTLITAVPHAHAHQPGPRVLRERHSSPPRISVTDTAAVAITNAGAAFAFDVLPTCEHYAQRQVQAEPLGPCLV